MFKNKKASFELKKENATINMVLAITTRSQISKVDAFKEKEMKWNKTTANW